MVVIPDSVQATQQEAGVQNLGGRSGGRRGGYIGTSATTTVTVRATAYTPQGTDAQRSIKSSSANDTSAGTGARTIRITYYKADASGPFTTDLTMNGTTAVATTATDIALLEKIEVITVGSGGGNAGTISIYTDNAGAGSVWGSIAIGDNQTYWAHHYVTSGVTCYITEAFVCAKANTGGAAVLGIATLNKLNPIDTTIVQKNLDVSYGYEGVTNPMHFRTPIVVTGPAILFLNIKPSATTASTAHGGFSFFEV